MYLVYSLNWQPRSRGVGGWNHPRTRPLRYSAPGLGRFRQLGSLGTPLFPPSTAAAGWLDRSQDTSGLQRHVSQENQSQVAARAPFMTLPQESYRIMSTTFNSSSSDKVGGAAAVRGLRSR